MAYDEHMTIKKAAKALNLKPTRLKRLHKEGLIEGATRGMDLRGFPHFYYVPNDWVDKVKQLGLEKVLAGHKGHETSGDSDLGRDSSEKNTLLTPLSGEALMAEESKHGQEGGDTVAPSLEAPLDE